MNKFFTAVATVITLSATVATAEDWNNTTYGVEMISGPLDFSIDADNNGLTDIEVGYTAFEYSINENIDSNVRFAFSSDLRVGDDISVIGQYNISAMATSDLMVYGTAEVSYTTDTGFNSGVWEFNPSAGVTYAFTDTVAVYGEVGYSWDMTNDFSQSGGYVEIGVPFTATEMLIITPSVSRTFDTGNDATNFRLEATFLF